MELFHLIARVHYHTTGKSAKSYSQAVTVLYLDNESAKDNTTEDKVIEDAFKDISFTMDLAGIEFVEKLHQYKSVEHNGVVFRRGCVERCIPSTVNVKNFLSCRESIKITKELKSTESKV